MPVGGLGSMTGKLSTKGSIGIMHYEGWVERSFACLHASMYVCIRDGIIDAKNFLFSGVQSWFRCV